MNYNPYSVGQDLGTGSPDRQGPTFDVTLRAMQITVVGLIMGPLVFLGVVLVLTQGNMSGKPGLLTMIAAGFAAVMIANHFVIPAITVKSRLRQASVEGLADKTDTEKAERVCRIYHGQLIIGLALLEGAAFFNMIALMAENCIASLGVVTLLVGLMLVKFPTRDKVSFWVADRLRELQLG